ncbi:MAG: peptidylprolyl isomerase [Bacteroidota bacterium]
MQQLEPVLRFFPPLLLLGLIACAPPAPTYPIAQITTPQGEMLCWLYEETPLHRESFLQLAEAHYWDSLSFNRVINGFVIQGGCPDTPEGFGDSPYLIDPEFPAVGKHRYGALGSGRDDNPEKRSAGCQLYLVHDKAGIERLDGNYVIFGQLFSGWKVLEAIATSPTDSLDQPLEEIPMQVRVVEMNAAELKAKGWEVEQTP